MKLQDPVTAIRGIGEKTADSLRKLNIETVQDLLSYYPRRYVGYEKPVPISEASDFERVTIQGTVCTEVKTHQGPRYVITTLSVRDASGSVKLVWYNSPYIRNILRKGETFCFVGIVRIKGRERVMEMPEYYSLYKYQDMLSVLQPVYPLTAGVKNHQLKKALQGAAEAIRSLQDELSFEVRERYGLMEHRDAVQSIHFPKDEAELRRALERTAFDEFYHFLLSVKAMREENVTLSSDFRITEEARDALKMLMDRLPYRLTDGQQGALQDILTDMSGGTVMNRLIQGDVGCGKTIVAAAALYVTVRSGRQGALMVPTEVLAMQHFQDISALFSSGDTPIRVALLVSSLSAKEKRAVKEGLKNGTIDLVIGTHALIQEGVLFRKLGLVVTDEQHRFGVRQRDQLAEKGDLPHVLVMSATPIPRSLAIILYADLDISLITELPGGRKKILNCVVGTDYRPTAYKFIAGEVAKGHQAYVICPKVEDDEGTELENVEAYAESLRGIYGDRISVGTLHGRMKEDEKQRVLNDFSSGRIQVLVATTVIEVGINNPNATVMMIENAERFGLAQLHQLRGRVGRGDAQSYCIFIHVKKTEESVNRLKVLEESNDGFHIAAEDLRLRGPGDFFGVRQSGDLMFKVANIYDHAAQLKAAQELVLSGGGS